MKLGTMMAVMLAAGLFTGCSARLTAVPISEKARLEMGRADGIPYYVPRPYLLVTRDLEITDEAMSEAGIEVDSLSRPASATATRSGNGGSGASGASRTGGVSSLDGEDEGSPTVQVKPTFRFRIVYLPDLTRQYALQQRGGAFSNVSIRYELQNGWLFTGTEIQAETQIPATIEATTSGIAGILGGSLEQVFASLFPIPTPDYGVSGVAGEEAGADVGPKIWLFEISDGPQGTLRINTDRPFFEWPKDSVRSSRPTRRPVEPTGTGTGGSTGSSRDPDVGDLPKPPPARRPETPATPPPASDARPPASSTDTAIPTPATPESATSPATRSPSPGATPPAPTP